MAVEEPIQKIEHRIVTARRDMEINIALLRQRAATFGEVTRREIQRSISPAYVISQNPWSALALAAMTGLCFPYFLRPGENTIRTNGHQQPKRTGLNPALQAIVTAAVSSAISIARESITTALQPPSLHIDSGMR